MQSPSEFQWHCRQSKGVHKRPDKRISNIYLGNTYTMKVKRNHCFLPCRPGYSSQLSKHHPRECQPAPNLPIVPETQDYWLSEFPQHDILHRISKTIQKVICKHKRPWIAKAILSRRSSAGDIIIPHLKIYHRAIVAKTSILGVQNKHVDQQSKLEDPEVTHTTT